MILGNYLACKCGAIGAPHHSGCVTYFRRTVTSEIFDLHVRPTSILPNLFHWVEIFVNGSVESIRHFGPMGSAQQSPSIALIG